MNAGITVVFRVGKLQFEAAGVYSTDNTLILSGTIKNSKQFDVIGSLMAEGCKGFGLDIDTSFLPSILIEKNGFSYNGKNSTYTIFIEFADGKNDILGRTQLQYSSKLKSYGLCLLYTKGFSLSDLPVAGDYIKDYGDVSFGNITVGYDSQDGFIFSTDLKIKVLDKKVEEPIEFKIVPPTDTEEMDKISGSTEVVPAGANVDQSKVKWKEINKKFGSVTLEAIGGAFSDGVILLMLNTSLSIGALKFTFAGLGVSIPFSDLKNTTAVISGIGIHVKTTAVEIDGDFYRKAESDSYTGLAMVRLKTFSFSLLGSFSSKPVTSVFAAAAVNVPIGGPPCFFITGFAAGFGYNRRLIIPDIEHLMDFPIFKLADGTMTLDDIGKLDNYFYISEGNYWLAAGIFFTTFKLIDSKAIITVSFGNYVEINLLGKSTMDFPIKKQDPKIAQDPVIAHVALLLMASFKPESYLVAIKGMLSNDSYVLSRDCHLSGGFAFYTWYGGDYAGDFVITLGGYRSNYNKPEHYPEAKRIGLSWSISSNLYAAGSLYFALTPSCIMTGGHIKCVFSMSRVEAWFDAELDIFIQWKPFYYEFYVGIFIGVKVKLWLFTVKLELGCSLHIWGPEFSGTAHVSLWCISFDINFKKNEKSSQGIIDAKDFSDTFLPKKDVKSNNFFNLNDATGGYGGCSIQACTGLIKEYTKNASQYWVMCADTMQIITKSKVPSTVIKFNENEVLKGGDLGIYPCNKSKITSIQDVKIDNLPEDTRLTFIPINEQVPFALWGDRNAVEKAETVSALTGMKIIVEQLSYYTLQCRQDFDHTSRKYEMLKVPFIEALEYNQEEAYRKINTTLEDIEVRSLRNNIVMDIDEQFIIDDLSDLAASSESLFCFRPMLETIGGERNDSSYCK